MGKSASDFIISIETIKNHYHNLYSHRFNFQHKQHSSIPIETPEFSDVLVCSVRMVLRQVCMQLVVGSQVSSTTQSLARDDVL